MAKSKFFGPGLNVEVERDREPLHLVPREAELVRNCVGHGALISLAVRRVVDLERRAFGLTTLVPGWVRGVSGCDREVAGGD